MNILNLADRWEERLPLLLADMAALRPDLIGLNEVVYPMQQDRLLGAAGGGRYKAVRGWAGRPEYGNSLLAKSSLATTDYDRIDLGMARSAHRVRIALPGGNRLLFAVTHLHHLPDDQEIRLGQVGRLLEWLDAAPEHEALILVGDFNADPREPAYAAMGTAGFTSAYAAANGAEPACHVALRPGGADDGHRRRAALPRLHLGPRLGRGEGRSPRVRSAGRR